MISSRLKNLKWLVVSALIILFDQVTKLLISRQFILYEEHPILPFFNLTFKHNQGAAFGFLANAGGWQQVFFCGIAIVMSVVLTIWLCKLQKNERWTAFAVALIIGGALGNLIDRLVLGYVVDYIDFYIKNWHFATFNLADSAISVGAAILIIEAIFSYKKVTNEDYPR
jgi:signal peptidase II